MPCLRGQKLTVSKKKKEGTRHHAAMWSSSVRSNRITEPPRLAARAFLWLLFLTRNKTNPPLPLPLLLPLSLQHARKKFTETVHLFCGVCFFLFIFFSRKRHEQWRNRQRRRAPRMTGTSRQHPTPVSLSEQPALDVERTHSSRPPSYAGGRRSTKCTTKRARPSRRINTAGSHLSTSRLPVPSAPPPISRYLVSGGAKPYLRRRRRRRGGRRHQARTRGATGKGKETENRK